MFETLETVLGAVVMIGLIAVFALFFIGAIGWALLQAAKYLIEYFRDLWEG